MPRQDEDTLSPLPAALYFCHRVARLPWPAPSGSPGGRREDATTVTYDPRADIIRITLCGDLTAEMVEETFLAMLRHPDFRRGMNALWDLTDARTTGLTSADIRRLVAVTRRHEGERGAARVAIVVADTADYGMGRMYELLDAERAVDLRIFRRPDAADRWLATGNLPESVEDDPAP